MSDNNTDSSSAGSIKPINSETVHKICSGQVVLSLAVAVKELVENSLDAGAKNIDVKLKDYGKELIEVSDDGSGVTEANFAALTLKYHTSKISDYSDLLGVSSYGFRGEALSSLCSLTNLSITTRHKDSTYATKIMYDHKGNITSKTPCSRQIGTTVTLSNLFKSLPVRQKEFHRNFKREFTKMTNLLYAYCLISTGVKITCSNQTSSNAKTLIVATQGSTSFKDNIACVFGIKQLQTLLEIKSEYVSNIKDNIFKGLTGDIKESEESVNIDDIEIDLSEDSNDAANEVTNSQESCTSQKSQGYKNLPSPVELTGYISSCAHGTGRSTTDRQYFFINSRPCEPTKVIKLINEVYRQYNPNQYPFVFLNINLDRISVDINVTPDKRKVFLTKEKGVLDVVKASLLKLFEDIPKTIKLESIKHNDASTHSNTLTPALDQTRVFNSFITKFSHNNSNISRACNENSDLKRKSTTLIDYGIVKKSHNNSEKTTETCLINKSDDYEIPLIKDCDSENIIVPQHERNIDTYVEETTWKKNDNVSDLMFLSDSSILPNTQIRNVSEIIEDSHQIYCKTKQSERPPKQKVKKVITDKGELGKCKRKSITLKTSMEHVKALFDVYKEKKNRNIPQRIKFKSTINPVFNKKCEEELSREISKESFKRMAIVGQFNLGFIITVLDDDLFIIDQHATDEIYNFETLQKTTELTSQKLVIPQKLELTGVNEQVLMDNLDVFKKNGFTFEIDKDASPTKRVKLLTIPMSKNWVFGKEDIEELLFMLRENYYEHCRPSRVRAMFASRACRKSVMIGTALSKADMRKLVDHMSEIDKPWNCPHGRPTIRHLINLTMVHTKED